MGQLKELRDETDKMIEKENNRIVKVRKKDLDDIFSLMCSGNYNAIKSAWDIIDGLNKKCKK